MYKHNASSIKESEDKQFVSLQDKNNWNSKSESVHTHEEYYNKEEIDSIIDVTYLECEGEIIHTQSVDGIIKDIEIFGNTEQKTEIINKTVTMQLGALDSSGIDAVRSDRSVSDFIEVNENDYITFFLNGVATTMNVFFYDKRKKFIKRDMGRVEGSDSVFDTRIPHGVSFIRIYSTVRETTDLKINRIYVNNIKSVGQKRADGMYEVDIVTTGKNMFNIDEYYNKIKHILGISREGNGIKFDAAVYGGVMNSLRDSNIKIIDGNKLCKNTSYRIKYKASHFNNLKCVIMVKYTDNTHELINDYSETVEFTTDKSKEIESILVSWSTQKDGGNSVLYDIEISPIITTNSNYEPYMEDRTTLLLPTPIEKIGNVKDRLFIREDGMVCIEKRVATVELNKLQYKFAYNESIYSPKGFMSVGLNYDGYKPDSSLYTAPIISDSFIERGLATNNNEPFESCTYYAEQHYTNRCIFLTLSFDRLGISSYDFTAFNNYIKSSNAIFKVEQAPEIIEVGYLNSILNKSYDDVTNIFIDNDVKPNIICKVPNNIGSSLDNITDNIEYISKNIENINNVTRSSTYLNTQSKNGVIHTSNTIDGFTDNFVIEGLTLVNLNRFGAYNIPKHNYLYTENLICEKSLIKTGVVYTVFIEYDLLNSDASYNIMEFGESRSNGVMVAHPNMTVDDQKSLIREYSSSKGVDKFTIRIKNWKSDEGVMFGVRPVRRYSSSVEDQYAEGTVKLTIVEGDHMDKDVRYFNGMVSVNGNINITSSDTNITTRKIDYSLPRVNYYLTNVLLEGDRIRNITDKVITILVHNISGTGWIKDVSLTSNEVYEVEKNTSVRIITQYNHMGWDTNSQNNINEIILVNDSIIDKKLIQLSSPLRSLPNGVKDTIEKINGKYCVVRRCGYKVLNGTEAWSRVNKQLTNTTRFGTSIIDNIVPNTVNFHSTYFMISTDNKQYNEDIEGISINNVGNLYIRINNSKLENTTNDNTKIDSFKKWLSNNNVEVVYDLVEPVIEELDSDINPRIFNGGSSIFVESGLIRPPFSFNLPINLQSSIKTILDKVRLLEESELYNYRLQLNNTYLSDRATYDLYIAVCSTQYEYKIVDNTIYDLLLTVILSGADNYKIEDIEKMIDFYTITGKISFAMADNLFNIISTNQFDIA